MKNILAKSAALTLAALICAPASASADEISILVNGAYLTPDAAPFIQNDRTLVPMRAIFEALGADIIWDEQFHTVHAYGADGTYIAVQIMNPRAYVNNIEYVLDTPAVISSDRTFVPVRFVAEALGADVSWNPDTQTVIITKQ